MDSKIIIKDLKIFAYHGVLTEEKENGQDFFLDITLTMADDISFESDELSKTVDYGEVCKTAVVAMTSNCWDLIEKAAQTVAEDILKVFPRVIKVCVTVKKPHAPMPYDFNYVAAEVNLVRDLKV